MKKIIPYIFILAIITGLFSPVSNVRAQAVIKGTCETEYTNLTTGIKDTPTSKVRDVPSTGCVKGTITKFPRMNGGVEVPYQSEVISFITGDAAIAADATASPDNGDPIDKAVNDAKCLSLFNGTVMGCIVTVTYYTLFQLSSFMLVIAAKLFNALISISLGSTVYNNTFLPAAWGVVRDIANIFFILILLYAAFQMITGLGHGGKKIIGQVLLMALLINFSMFFSKVIIDSSNILALVFYNKIEVKTTGNAYEPSIDTAKTGVPDKDMAGAIASGFNPAATMDPTIFSKAVVVNGVEQEPKSLGILLGVIVLSSAIYIVAAYAFFVSAFAFLGRLIELFLLIIFSPFAFMSFAVPKLAGLEYLGWEKWSSKIVEVSFMAPIFMFMIYLIAKITEKNFTKELFSGNQGFLGTLLLLIIPAMISIGLLLKATSFAKKGSGQFGEAVMSGAKMVGGLAIGAATGGAALVATGTIGRGALNAANNEDTRKLAASGNKWAQRKLATANYFGSKSFDIRQSGAGKLIEKQTGMNLNNGLAFVGLDKKGTEHGRHGQEERRIKEQQALVKTFNMTPAAALHQDELHKEYLQDKNNAKERMGRDFNEKDFKKVYSNGDKDALKFAFGISKEKINPDAVNSSKDINKERKDAYAVSLENQAKKEQGRSAMRNFWEEILKNAGATSKTGLAVNATIALATGGLSIPVVAGVGFLRALRQTLDVKPTDHEVIAAVRKGPDPRKELLNDLKKEMDGDKKEHGDEHAGGGNAPAVHAKEASADHAPKTTAHDSHAQH